MQAVVQAVILGVLTGGVYALMASGLTLVFGIMRVINVAQGAFVILSAYLSQSLFSRLGIEGLLSVFYSTTDRNTATSYADKAWTVGGYQFSEPRVFGFATSVVVLAVLYAILRFSRFGRSIRAVVQNPMSARLLGVNEKLVSACGFGIGAATAAAAGALYGVIFPFNPGSHYDLISRLLSIVVLGGLGSIGGAIVAALVMGIVQSEVAVEYSPTWAALSFFVVLLAVLLVRPQGFFGVRERIL